VSETVPRRSIELRWRPSDERPRPDCGWCTLGGLAELNGKLGAQIAGLSVSIVLERGAAWGPTPSSDVALLTVEEGFVVISAVMGEEAGNAHQDNAGRRIVLATGESGTLLPPPAPGERLEAVTPCRITVISADSLRALLGFPAMAEAIADALAAALAERHATIRNCAYVRHCERVREKLLQLARGYGRVVPGGVRIDFPLTQQLLADMVGSARETVSLALAELGREGFVHRQHRRYVLRIGSDDLVQREHV
jgi:CRP-like cAMP-binding protein